MANLATLFPILLLIQVQLLPQPVCCSWLLAAQLASALQTPDYYNCQMQPGLAKKQREICTRHPAAMRAISDGLRSAIDECHSQFERERWNCSATFSIGGPARGAATAETAFIYAISSGGASHAVARACAQGAIPECGCGGGEQTVNSAADSLPNNADPQQFIWAGCSDNPKFANQFTRKFIDATERQRTDARALMNLHNNRVGRRMLASNMRKQCKCHGVSGSCVTKTCWRTVPKLEELAALLKKKYERAQQVGLASDSFALVLVDNLAGGKKTKTLAENGGAMSRTERFLKAHFQPARLANRADLVFLESSPDYCVLDMNGGDGHKISGTSGRECFSANECAQLCCGKGWTTRKEIRQEPCHCKFVWCCDVKCETCFREIERRFCK